jgi:hypothetical protein
MGVELGGTQMMLRTIKCWPSYHLLTWRSSNLEEGCPVQFTVVTFDSPMMWVIPIAFDTWVNGYTCAPRFDPSSLPGQHTHDDTHHKSPHSFQISFITVWQAVACLIQLVQKHLCVKWDLESCLEDPFTKMLQLWWLIEQLHIDFIVEAGKTEF